MDPLVQSLIQEIPDSVTTTLLLEYVPRFLQEAQSLTCPGAEKKAAVLKALCTLVELLKDAGKVTGELEVELKAFITVTVAPTIDLMIGAYKGTLTPASAPEVTQRVNCFLQLLRTILVIVKTAKTTKTAKINAEKASETAEVKIEVTEATEAAEVKVETA